jgi:hypothetical protein
MRLVRTIIALLALSLCALTPAQQTVLFSGRIGNDDSKITIAYETTATSTTPIVNTYTFLGLNIGALSE